MTPYRKYNMRVYTCIRVGLHILTDDGVQSDELAQIYRVILLRVTHSSRI